jgi:hypothetical protein
VVKDPGTGHESTVARLKTRKTKKRMILQEAEEMQEWTDRNSWRLLHKS